MSDLKRFVISVPYEATVNGTVEFEVIAESPEEAATRVEWSASRAELSNDFQIDMRQYDFSDLYISEGH